MISAAMFLSFALSGAALPKAVIPPTPQEAKPGDLQAFYGKVVEVNQASRTITLGMPMRFTFKVPAESEITLLHGGATTFVAIKPGTGAQVVARRGLTGWTARKITLELKPTFPDEPSAQTADGKVINGLAVADYVTYEPPHGPSRHFDIVGRTGLFLLSLRPDGTVASVRTLKSQGSEDLDNRTRKRLEKMKFRPGALTEVRLPDTFIVNRRY